MKTTFDIPGNLFSDENRLEWSGKPILVARKTFAGESGYSVFFEIATAEDDYILTQLGEVVSLSDCQCWWPMPTPSFNLSGLPHEKPATTELAAEPRFNPAGPLYYPSLESSNLRVRWGLTPRKNQVFTLFSDLETAKAAARLKGPRNFLIRIDAVRLAATGYVIELSEDGSITTGHISPKYLSRIETDETPDAESAVG